MQHPDQIGPPDKRGHITVAVRDRIAPDPTIPGYKPYWVNVNLDRDPVRIVSYAPTETPEEQRTRQLWAQDAKP